MLLYEHDKHTPERNMGYKVLGKTEDLLKGYEPRKGLEGPFIYGNGQVLYYDPRAGQYWDPKTDFFVDYDDVARLKNSIFDIVRG